VDTPRPFSFIALSPLLVGDLRSNHLQESFRQRQTVRTYRVTMPVALEIAVLLLALLTVQELGHQIDTQLLPVRHQVLRL